MQNNNYVAIMAGGIGSRFWPASREQRPKQFLDISGSGKSLIRQTFERFLKICPATNIFVVTNGMYKNLVLEHLPELTDNQVLCEPSRNNTAPCVAYTAFKLYNLNPDANFIIAPSDAVVKDEEAFVGYLQEALAFTATNDAIVTLGIQPTRPDTGYGYINFKEDVDSSVKKVIQFKEKPDLATARAYLDSGDYLWNAGIFVWRAAYALEQFKRHATEIYDILVAGSTQYNTPQEQTFIDLAYPTTPSISVDYAIMEKSEDVYTIPSEFGWSDLGTWNSLHVESAKDEANNAINGKVLLSDVNNSLIRLPAGKLLVAKGLDDFIIVDEGDVLLIYPKSKEQEIKAVTKMIEDKKYK